MGPSPRVNGYRVFKAACSVGKPTSGAARRWRAFRESIAWVENRTRLISMSRMRIDIGIARVPSTSLRLGQGRPPSLRTLPSWTSLRTRVLRPLALGKAAQARSCRWSNTRPQSSLTRLSAPCLPGSSHPASVTAPGADRLPTVSRLARLAVVMVCTVPHAIAAACARGR